MSTEKHDDEQKPDEWLMQPREGMTIYKIIGKTPNGNYRVVRDDWHERVPKTTSN